MATNGAISQQSRDHGDAFFESLPRKNLLPLWTQLAEMVPPLPNPTTTTAVWKYSEVKPLLMEAGEIVDAEEAERRVLMLVNPAMGNNNNPKLP
jgi:gentisate 1,2-dioxygenase